MLSIVYRRAGGGVFVRLRAGIEAPDFHVDTIDGRSIALGTFAGRPLLMMFFRYASCAMCNLRLHDLADKLPPLRERGLAVVGFFHSSASSVRAAAGSRRYPLHLVGDSDYTVYRAYGVETSWPRLVLSAVLPSFYVDWARAMRHGFWGGAARQMGKMPADFLIDRDGRIATAHYGTNIGDHLSLSTIQSFVDATT
jgi:peroxiredoxin